MLITDCGQAMYGERWQSALARDLGVCDRTVRRWAAGSYDMPGIHTTQLLRLMRERAEVLRRLVEALDASVPA
jgi:hypothetical protein